MTKIPFKVSARTARLIGRENVANAEGAIIELVKNSYDADSKNCFIFLDLKYDKLPLELSNAEYKKFVLQTPNSNLISKNYTLGNNNYKINKGTNENNLKKLETFFNSKSAIYIIDTGEGMTQKVITDHWMTIGTSNKLVEIFTDSGRVKAGAKGIGRFALDRLGGKCIMLTKPKNNSMGFRWKVNWEDFEKGEKIIGQINADLYSLKNIDFFNQILLTVDDPFFAKILKDHQTLFKNGTLLKITHIRDEWTTSKIEKLFSNLEILSPPEGSANFKIFLYTQNDQNNFGEVNNTSYEDYDYKIDAKILRNKNIKINISRKEFDLKTIDKALFKEEDMRKYPYDYETFKRQSYEINTDVYKLIPGLRKIDKDQLVDKIGEFSFHFYFLKNTMSAEKEKNKFNYKYFDSRQRQLWLKKFGGIKIFRDNFRVRPYGEIGSTAYDWLGLGDRASTSPQSVTKKGAGYKVRPHQVVGVINISRLSNLEFDDKSSREGFQENTTFELFKNLIIKLIELFEDDRHIVMSSMNSLYVKKNQEEEAKTKANEISMQDDEGGTDEKTKEEYVQERETFKTAYEALKNELLDAEEEIKILRALATSGLLVTSFAHEFRTIRNNLTTRTSFLISILNKHLDQKKFKNTPTHLNPYSRINMMKEQDDKIKSWIDFSLNAIKMDKRRRRKIDLGKYFKDFKSLWKQVLKFREIDLLIHPDTDTIFPIRAFAIDLDSVFNNLLANSIDAFQTSGFSGKREINITLYNDFENKQVEIKYRDSGSGLSKDITSIQNIFKAGYSTKINEQGDEIGTGLGMWIAKNALDEYSGQIEILKPKNGFEAVIKLPRF